MKPSILSSLILSILTFNSITVFCQFKVENDGSIYINSYGENWDRANWTKVHNQYTCAYHLWNTYYNSDVFYVRGDGQVWTRLGFLVASDTIFKTNIQEINSPLEMLKGLRGVKYNRKYLANNANGDTNHATSYTQNIQEQKIEPAEYGLLAQEVEKIIPEVVQTMHDSSKAISYLSLITNNN